ncbi:hypothetical protein [Halosimplex halobium]|uniref:hypothetical protein n=1 Tax=Halosimplex halobium TaxID=3396618 RepID=UPI003F543441
MTTLQLSRRNVIGLAIGVPVGTGIGELRSNGRDRESAGTGYGAVPAGTPTSPTGVGTRLDTDGAGATPDTDGSDATPDTDGSDATPDTGSIDTAGSERTNGRSGYGAAAYSSPTG